jgi:hypothetical protein
MRSALATLTILLGLAPGSIRAAEEASLADPSVRGLVTRAKGAVAIDGDLAEWAGAFCTPVHYNHRDLSNRAAQFFYLWDDDALYIGLRALDQKRADPGQPGSLWNGDAVEFYLDTRRGESLRSKDWSDGAIHLFYSPFEGTEVKPRWAMRQGIATSGTVLKGVALAAKAHDWGYEVEFKIPWANFPGFKAEPGAAIAFDAELCSGDGGGRTDRTFAYGSPLSVQQPASLAKLELVRELTDDLIAAVGPACFPLWVETPWVQSERAQVQAVVAIAPSFLKSVQSDGSVVIRLHDPDGKVLKALPARIEVFDHEGLGFARAVARWSIDDFAPGAYFATAEVRRGNKVLATAAPRMVHEANISGR